MNGASGMHADAERRERARRILLPVAVLVLVIAAWQAIVESTTSRPMCCRRRGWCSPH